VGHLTEKPVEACDVLSDTILAGRATGFDTGGDGIPLVLLHAYPLSPEMWRHQLRELAGAARVIAPAFPGFAGAKLEPDGWSVDTFADWLADALTAAGVTSAVVGGLSMGGYAALAFARRHPDKLRGLILADTKAEPDAADAKANRDKMIAFAREHGAAAVIDAMLPKMVSEHTRQQRPQVVTEVKRIASAQSVEAIQAALRALRDRPDATTGLANIRVPTLVIVGANDELTPPDAARKMTKVIPGALQIDILSAGHLSSLETPTEFNAAVRSFLTNLPDPPGR
jgi:3-oxoadipate enol-lactonase